MKNMTFTKKGTGRKAKFNTPGYSLGEKFYGVKHAKILKKILKNKVGIK